MSPFNGHFSHFFHKNFHSWGVYLQIHFSLINYNVASIFSSSNTVNHCKKTEISMSIKKSTWKYNLWLNYLNGPPMLSTLGNNSITFSYEAILRHYFIYELIFLRIMYPSTRDHSLKLVGWLQSAHFWLGVNYACSYKLLPKMAMRPLCFFC